MGLGLKTRARRMAEAIAFSGMVSMRSRWKVLRRLGWSGIGPAHIRDGCYINGTDLTTAPGCYFNREVLIDCSAAVTLGSHVQIGPRAMIMTATHQVGEQCMRAGAPDPRPITIGDGVWIGAGAIVLPGVTVGDGCIIAGGAVVTTDCAPDGLYAGCPAVRHKDLPVASHGE
ncbi:acyltransferase [Raineyella sp. LH-20]|uniref:acyltransferase n=1 Tax=Raineyella sp. LH-20 TaxID=3081204 RepID=UPI00295486EA|nr:DapH/DapD/GlmU-related protein [Raineyella sp. LH-20]WOP17571.1 DapH/DapD/GlmU-related protein [Raineyella sp. LH-20]